jgi:hypothetical protein
MDKRYHFIGEGAGVPGLPHELTDREALALGVEALLAQALELGTYEEVKEAIPSRALGTFSSTPLEVTPSGSLGAKPPKAGKATAKESD